MNIVVVGLGIIGGSYCKAIKTYTKHTVIGINRTESVAKKALDCGAIDMIGIICAMQVEADGILALCENKQTNDARVVEIISASALFSLNRNISGKTAARYVSLCIMFKSEYSLLLYSSLKSRRLKR